jgi:hypothetical protein
MSVSVSDININSEKTPTTIILYLPEHVSAEFSKYPGLHVSHLPGPFDVQVSQFCAHAIKSTPNRVHLIEFVSQQVNTK